MDRVHVRSDGPCAIGGPRTRDELLRVRITTTQAAQIVRRVRDIFAPTKRPTRADSVTCGGIESLFR